MERVRSILAVSELGEELWAEALMAVVSTRNRGPTGDGRATPLELLHGKRPDFACLLVWGSVENALKPKGQQRKLQPKNMVRRVVGCRAEGHAYRVYNPVSRKVVVRWDVFAEETSVRAPGSTSSAAAGMAPESDTDLTARTDNQSNATTGPPDSAPSQPDSPPQTPSYSEPVDHAPKTSSDAKRGGPISSTFGGGRYPERWPRPKRFFGDGLGAASQAVMSAFTSEALRTVPVTVKEAMARPDAHLWREAMQDELRSLAEKNAWEMMDPPPGAQLTGSRWVFDLKRDAAGNTVPYKAWFVVRGFTLKPGVDYDEVWAPTPANVTVRAVLALAAARGVEINCLDINTAYPNSILDKEMYVKQPHGYEVGGNKLVCRILRAVYGCKQASR